jgi:glycerol-3-phosphate dehydrogenase
VSEAVDLLVIGGGINGAAIARDAAGRGLDVLLCDKSDLAGATSSASSKLIHGGLRYLEHGEFRLVRESLAEREILLRMAPHLVRPLCFVLPLGPASRPVWLLRAGLFLYDRLGGARSLPPAAMLDLGEGGPLGAPLRDDVRGRGFTYADCRTDDSRLTILTARDAADRGAAIAPRTEFVAARRAAGWWQAELRDGDGPTRGAVRTVRARALVNAAGPWASDVLGRAGLTARTKLRLVKGSHIVVPKLYDGDHAYLLQNDDRRIVFVLPFERDWSLIGTTELPYAGDPAAVQISGAEIAYLCRAVGRWLRAAPQPDSIVWAYAGVRPLYDNRARSAAAATRDYVLELDRTGPPTLSVFGGKLTTHRRLAEHALGRLAPFLPAMRPPWTAGSRLPGGDGLPTGGTVSLAGELRRRYKFLAGAAAARLAETYGSAAGAILANGPGRDFGHGLTEAELRWLSEREWAMTAADVLWRRTKLGLRMTAAEAQAVADYLEAGRPTSPMTARENTGIASLRSQ